MIPKIINYCWFGGGDLDELSRKCIDSWSRLCPDYKIVKWDESNFDISSSRYAKEAYEGKMWAFVSDYARLKIIYGYGGFYLDTDVELIKSLDSLRVHDCYVATECIGRIATGLSFGAKQQSPLVEAMLAEYDNCRFSYGHSLMDLTPCPERNTMAFLKLGYCPSSLPVKVGDAIVYPPEFFSPKDWETGEVVLTQNTISIHHFNATWREVDPTTIEHCSRELSYAKKAFRMMRDGGIGSLPLIGRRFSYRAKSRLLQCGNAVRKG